MVKASAPRADDLGLESRFHRDFPVSSHTSDLKKKKKKKKKAFHWLPCQVPGEKGSALGLVGPMSVYCDWVRWTLSNQQPTNPQKQSYEV